MGGEGCAIISKEQYERFIDKYKVGGGEDKGNELKPLYRNALRYLYNLPVSRIYWENEDIQPTNHKFGEIDHWESIPELDYSEEASLLPAYEVIYTAGHLAGRFKKR